MLISTRGRYALRVIIDMSESNSADYIPLKDIAQRQNISQKYMENIMTLLSKNDFVDSIHGKGGGYRLNRDPKDYKIGDILRLTEGSLAPVACLEHNAQSCNRKSECKTFPMWEQLNNIINNYLDSITIADLITNTENKE